MSVLSCRVHDLLHSLWYERIFSLVFYALVPFDFYFYFFIQSKRYNKRIECGETNTANRRKRTKKDKTRSQSLLLLKCEIKLFDLRAHRNKIAYHPETTPFEDNTAQKKLNGMNQSTVLGTEGKGKNTLVNFIVINQIAN